MLLSPEASPGSAAWSPDGQWFAAAGVEHVLRVWKSNGEPECVLDGNPDLITSLAWSPESRQIIVGGVDHSLILWDVASRQSRWIRRLLSDNTYATISQTGELLDGEPAVVERDLVFLVQDDDGATKVLTPAEFQKRRK
jgi:WD40 repeat protein